MKYTEDIQPISNIKTNSAQMLDQINETRRPIVITQNGKARGVFIDPKSFEEMKRALGILKLISQSEQDIVQGKVKPQKQVFSDLEKQLFNGKN